MNLIHATSQDTAYTSINLRLTAQLINIVMTDIATLIEHAESLVKSAKQNSYFTAKSTTPAHLFYDINRISHRYELTGDISFRDIEYLETIYESTPQYLLNNIYMLGEWYEWQSHKHRNYNLKRHTQPTKVKGFIKRR